MSSTPRRFTQADLQRLPESNSPRYEIIDGELFVTPSASRTHQRLVLRLVTALDEHAEKHGAGEVYVSPFDVLFDDYNVVIPDVLFVSAPRLALIKKNGVHGAPDLVVEVLSPGTKRMDLTRKKALYERRGVREYWIVDPDRRAVTVMARMDTRFGVPRIFKPSAGRNLTTDLLPGFSLDLDRLFR